MRPTDGLITFEETQFSSLKVAVRSLAKDARGVDAPETREPEANEQTLHLEF